MASEPLLGGDDIVKVNVWTIFERLGGQAVARHVIQQLANILPGDELRALQTEGWLGPRYFEVDFVAEQCGGELGPKLDGFREEARRDVWQAATIARMNLYLRHFNYDQSQ